MLGVAKRCAPSEMDSVSVRTTVLGMSRSRIGSERRANLMLLPEKLDWFPATDGRLLKRHLVVVLLKAQEDFRNGTLVVPGETPQDTAREESNFEKSQKLVRALQEASLNAWVMGPLVTTAGMKEGTMN